jgi:hypothetical protein
MTKSQISNHNYQVNPNEQNSKLFGIMDFSLVWDLVLGISDFIWDLVLGAWDFSKQSLDKGVP